MTEHKAQRSGDAGNTPGSPPEGVIDNTSPNNDVFINNEEACGDGSTLIPIFGSPPNEGKTTDGSGTVFVHNNAIGFQGNIDSLGGIRASGSDDVFVGSTGVSYLVDNTENYTVEPPIGVKSFTSPFVQYVQEHDDEDSADPPGVQAPGITAERYPIPQTIEEDQVPPPPLITPTQDCSDIDALPPSFDWNNTGMDYEEWSASVALSDNFTVYDLTAGPAVSTWILEDNVGLSQKEILQNLCFLAKTILEPMKAQYPAMIITSGWRRKSGKSQHNKGQAVDIQVPGFKSQEYWESSQWIKDNTNFDQFILEYGGRNPWFHISTNGSGHRQQVLTMKGTGVFVFGLVRVV